MAHASLWPILRHHWPHQSMVHLALHRARTPDATYGSWCVCYGVTRPPPKPADCARLFSLSTPHGQVWLYALSSLGCGQAAAALAEVGPTAIPHADLQSVAGPASLIFLDRGIIEVTQTIAWYLTSLASQPALHVDWTNMWMCHGMPQVTKVVPMWRLMQSALDSDQPVSAVLRILCSGAPRCILNPCIVKQLRIARHATALREALLATPNGLNFLIMDTRTWHTEVIPLLMRGTGIVLDLLSELVAAALTGPAQMRDTIERRGPAICRVVNAAFGGNSYLKLEGRYPDQSQVSGEMSSNTAAIPTYAFEHTCVTLSNQL